MIAPDFSDEYIHVIRLDVPVLEFQCRRIRVSQLAPVRPFGRRMDMQQEAVREQRRLGEAFNERY